MRVDVDQRRLASGIGKQVEFSLCKRVHIVTAIGYLLRRYYLLLLRQLNDIFASLSLSLSLSYTYTYTLIHIQDGLCRLIQIEAGSFLSLLLSLHPCEIYHRPLYLSLSCEESHSAFPGPNKKKKEVEERVLWLDSLG